MDTDVIIVGGGAAGVAAALAVHERGLRCVIVCKGLVGRSGASIFAGNLALAGHLLGNTDQNAQASAEHLIKYHNQFLIDQQWAKACGNWIESTYYPMLEREGLYFRRDAQGHVVTSPGMVRSVAANKQGHSGVAFMAMRRKQVIRAGIPRFEETVVTRLLKDGDGRVCGVVCLSIMTGETMVIRAPAVVLATGYSDRLHTRSTGTREMSADGLAMAWNAGASMCNLEMQWWHTNDVAQPQAWQRMQIYPNPILGSEHSARMLNSQGEVFFDQQVDAPVAFGPYTVQLKALARQVRAGKASYAGGYYASFSHIPADELRAHTTYAKPFDQLALQDEHGIECAVTAHYRQGGIWVNPFDMRSTVAGLYVAGGIGAHSNGFMALVSFDGETVAATVAKDLESQARRLVSAAAVLEQANEEVKRLEHLRTRASPQPVMPRTAKAELQALMAEHAGVEKSAGSLAEGLDRLSAWRHGTLPRVCASTPRRTANYSWVDAIDVHSMHLSCELILLSSLERKESRGPFFRSDYPYTDNDQWLAANVLHKKGDGHVFERHPYPPGPFVPGFSRRLNSEVAW